MRADIFALGMSIAELLLTQAVRDACEMLDHADYDGQEDWEEHVSETLRSREAWPSFAKLLECMLAYDPSDRPSAKAVLTKFGSHPAHHDEESAREPLTCDRS